MIMSVDMSLRSTGVCVIDKNDELLHFELLKTDAKRFPDDEGVIIHLRRELDRLMLKFLKTDQFVIEGLSFGAKSSKKDVIAGAYWGLRTLIYRYYPNVLIGSVPVNSWRNWVTTKDERDAAKKECKDPLKNVVFRKLPGEVQRDFLLYVEGNGWGIKSVFDLADAYWIARFRNSLNE